MQISRLILTLISAALAAAADLYVSPSGSDTAAGTLAAPFRTIPVAIAAAVPGTTIYLRAGTYAPTTPIAITKSGTAALPYTLRAYSGEAVLLDGESLPYTPADLDASLPNASRGILHIEGAQYWRFYDLVLANGPYGVYARDSSNCIYERLVTRENYESGFQLQGAAANNTIRYLDSWGNRDPRKNGESADGLAIKEGSGDGNVVDGARLWNNVDDGLDFWEFKSPITVTNTLAWGNGYNRWGFSPFEGDGNGFKLGGGDAADIGPAAHKVSNCIAFQNAAGGFVDNSQPGVFTINRNTAWSNAGVGFKMTTATATLTGNVAAANANEKTLSTDVAARSSGNSWDLGGTWANSSFVSIDSSLVKGARQASGKIVASTFLQLKSGQAVGATTTW